MIRTQVFELVNNAYKQAVGAEAAIITEDLQSVVDAGNAIFDTDAKETFTKALIDQIGRIKIESKSYKGRYPKMLREAWEYGSVLMTVKQRKLPKATINESWTLEDATSYDPNITTIPSDIEVKFYNGRICFEIPYTIVNYQLKEAFQGPDQLAAFVGMLITNVNNAMDLAIGNLTKRCLNNMIAKTVYNEYSGSGYSTKSGVRAINLLKLYNVATGESLTKTAALQDKDFLRFAAKEIAMHTEHLKEISEIFNISGVDTFSSEIETVYLDEFAKSVGVYLYNAPNQYATDFLALPAGTQIGFWQDQGDGGFALADVSKISVVDDENHTTTLDYILAVQYDVDSCMVACLDRHTTSNYNARAEFTNFWDKCTMGLFNDASKNFLVYFLA